MLVCLVSLAILWWDHPFDAVILAAICFANLWQIRSRRDRWMFAAVSVVISAPAVLYYQWLKTNAGFSTLGTAQNLMLSPSPLSLIAGILPLLLLSAPAALRLWKDHEKRRFIIFVITWFVVQCVLAFLPLPFQRRLLAGIQLPLALLASITLSNLRSKAAVAAVVIVCSAGSFVAMSRQIREISSSGMPFYLPDAYITAFKWMDQQEKKGVILSGFFTGNFIPGYTGFTAYTGHSSLTVRARDKRRNVEVFYRNPDPRFLAQNGISWIFWGLEEQHFGGAKLDPSYPVLHSSGPIRILAAH
jgi:hypothetical protein